MASHTHNISAVMLKTQTKAISIITGKDHPRLSKEQKAFNTLIKKIDEKRASLAAWQEIIPSYQKKYTSDFIPLVETSQEIQIELVRCLDRAGDQKGLTSPERRMLHDLISGMAGNLAAERNDEELKNIYNKHSGSDFDKEAAASLDDLKSMLEDVIGVDLGDDLDMNSPEKYSSGLRPTCMNSRHNLKLNDRSMWNARQSEKRRLSK